MNEVKLKDDNCNLNSFSALTPYISSSVQVTYDQLSQCQLTITLVNSMLSSPGF
jgi:hypothetical protein